MSQQKSIDVFYPEKTVFTPPEVSALGVRQLEFIKKNQHLAIPLLIPGMDNYFAPMMPGQSAAVIAQTSNYKSGLADHWEKQVAQWLKNQGRINEVIVHVSTEETIEEQAFRVMAQEMHVPSGKLSRGDISNNDWGRLIDASLTASGIPIFRVGVSLQDVDYFPSFNMSNILEALRFLRDRLTADKLKIAFIVYDYLQDFDFDESIRQMPGKDQRRLQVRNDIMRIFHSARYFKCATATMVQAKQILGGAPSKKLYIPGIYDGEETSSIAQKFHRIIQAWLPKMNFPVGTENSYGDFHYTVAENLLMIKVGKQRGGLPAGRLFPCRIDYPTGRIAVEPLPGVDPFAPMPAPRPEPEFVSEKQL